VFSKSFNGFEVNSKNITVISNNFPRSLNPTAWCGTKIDDHISYIMVRIDPDKVTPVMDEAASKKWLETKK
jgi:hypothetical protein